MQTTLVPCLSGIDLAGAVQVLCGLGAVSCILAIVLHEVLSRTPDAVAATAEAAKAPKSPVKNPNIFTAFRYASFGSSNSMIR